MKRTLLTLSMLLAAGMNTAQASGHGHTAPATGHAPQDSGPLVDLAREAQEVASHLKPASRQVHAKGGHGASPHWGYSGQTGPRHWGDLSSRFIQCRIGRNQSPVNLRDKLGVGTIGLPSLEVRYKPVRLNIINNGHTIQVNYPVEHSYLKIGGHPYALLQFHFHTPSEHQKEGFNYPMEMHLVHKDEGGNLAVIGILFKEGAFNSELDRIIRHLPKKVGKAERHKNVVIRLTKFFPQNTLFYKYSGSLTTPPCSEGVYWMVFRQPIEAAPEQIEAMQRVMGHNARPVQPLNSRHVLKSWADTEVEDAFYYY